MKKLAFLLVAFVSMVFGGDTNTKSNYATLSDNEAKIELIVAKNICNLLCK